MAHSFFCFCQAKPELLLQLREISTLVTNCNIFLKKTKVFRKNADKHDVRFKNQLKGVRLWQYQELEQHQNHKNHKKR